MNSKLNIQQANISNLNALSLMFDEYRQFYQQPSDIERCKEFLKSRIDNKQSVAYIAEYDGNLAGFVHLYPSFSSVSLNSIWTLNDLWVRPFARREGVALSLMEHAKDLAIKSGAIYLQLATAKDNIGAQHLYESLGYRRDNAYYHYTLTTPNE